MSLDDKTVLDALGAVQEPRIGRSVVELGLVKNLKVKRRKVSFGLRLITPPCDATERLRAECEQAVSALDSGLTVEVNPALDVPGAPTAHRRVLKGVKNIVAVASGKGGVAKSTTAANVALALSQAGARVGVLDADIYGPSMPTMLTVEDAPSVGPGQQLNPAVAHGMQMISIGFFVPEGRAAILRGPMVSGYVTQFIGNTNWPELDYLIIDYPPGTGDIQLTLSQQAPITAAVLTTTPQEVSLVDVRKAIAMFETTKVPVVGVVETMSYFVCDGCDKRHDIFRSGGGKRVAEAAGVAFLGQVPIDPRVAQGGDDGQPVVVAAPESPAAEAYVELAHAIAAQLAQLNLERGTYLESFSLDWDPS